MGATDTAGRLLASIFRTGPAAPAFSCSLDVRNGGVLLGLFDLGDAVHEGVGGSFECGDPSELHIELTEQCELALRCPGEVTGRPQDVVVRHDHRTSLRWTQTVVTPTDIYRGSLRQEPGST